MLKWRGDKIPPSIDKVVRVAINTTMGACVAYAKANHSFINRTGTLERSIRIVQEARTRAARSLGVWGSAQVVYALFIEFGTFRINALPFLRPSAQVNYPKLAPTIKRLAKEAGF